MLANFRWLPQKFPHLTGITPLKTGGQKAVFRCRHPKYGECALKIILPGRENRIDRELEAVARLQQIKSPYVPKVYEYGIVPTYSDRRIWILEEFIDGMELSDIIAAQPLSKDQLLQLASNLLSIIANAELVNVVHRDIKPENVKIDSNGQAWLLDFGIARILDLDSKTATSDILGPRTLGYCPPEQLRNQKDDISSRTDLFAVGVVLYESVMQINPYLHNARDQFETMRRIENDAFPPLSLPWDTRGRFSEFVAALTQRQFRHRPDTGKEALAWFEDIKSDLGSTT